MPYRDHAVVIGGSMAGLLAGRSLANHFRRVTIIERDFFPLPAAPRPGLPQSRFLHVLLKRGQLILEDFFPGLTEELIAAGAPQLQGTDLALYLSIGKAAPYPDGLHSLSFSRDLLDWTVRRRLSGFQAVQFLQGGTVTQLLPNADSTGVSGVVVRRRKQDMPNHIYEEQIEADFVVDASGKGSHAPQWLCRIGYEPPTETVVNAHIWYAHRMYQRPVQIPTDWQALLIQATPPTHTRMGILFPVEGNRWMVGLGGGSHDHPPNDLEGYLEFARSLPTPELYNAIKNATPLSDIHHYSGNENRLRAYDRMRRYPENFVVMGHAACAFNPVYAQGMTTAALEAQVLDRQFSRARQPWISRNLAQHIQQQLAQVQATPWMMAISQDYRYPQVQSQQPMPMMQLLNWYQDQIWQLLPQSPEVHRTMMAVIHMLKPPIAMFSPPMLWYVLMNLVRQRVLHQRTLSRCVQCSQPSRTVT